MPRLAEAGVTDVRVVMPHPPPRSPFTAGNSAVRDQLTAMAKAFRKAAGTVTG